MPNWRNEHRRCDKAGAHEEPSQGGQKAGGKMIRGWGMWRKLIDLRLKFHTWFCSPSASEGKPLCSMQQQGQSP